MLWSPRHTSVGLRAKFVGRKGNWLVAAQGRLLAVRSFQSSCSVTESPACTAMASQRQLLADQSCPEAESDSGQLQIQRPLYGATTPSARPAQFGQLQPSALALRLPGTGRSPWCRVEARTKVYSACFPGHS